MNFSATWENKTDKTWGDFREAVLHALEGEFLLYVEEKNGSVLHVNVVWSGYLLLVEFSLDLNLGTNKETNVGASLTYTPRREEVETEVGRNKFANIVASDAFVFWSLFKKLMETGRLEDLLNK